MILRSEDEIQAAHDRLVAIMLGEIPYPYQNRYALTKLEAAASVLCWILGHEHNTSFGENLERIDRFMRAEGYELTELS